MAGSNFVGTLSDADALAIMASLKGELIETSAPLDREARAEYLEADLTGPAAAFQQYGRTAAAIQANPFDAKVAEDKLERHASAFAAIRKMLAEEAVIAALDSFSTEAVLALPDTIEPAEGGLAEYELMVNWMHERPDEWDMSKRLIVGAVGEGFKTAELIYDEYPGAATWWWPERVAERPQEYFGYNTKGEFCIATPLSVEGVEINLGDELDPAKFFDVTYRATDLKPYGRGYCEPIFWPWVLKRAAIALWGDYLDRYAHGIFHGQSDNKEDRVKIDAFFKNLGRRRGITTDLAAKVNVLSARLGGGQVYKNILDYLDQKISMAITGQTLATSEGQRVGSLAMARVHADTFGLWTAGRARFAEGRAKNFMARWLSVNFHRPRVPIYRIDARQAEDLAARANRDKTLVVDIGVPVPPDYWYDVYGLPRPESTPTPEKAAGRFAISVDRRIPRKIKPEAITTYREGPAVLRLAKKRGVREVYAGKVKSARKMEGVLVGVEAQARKIATPALREFKAEALGAIKGAKSYRRAEARLKALSARPSGAWAEGVVQGMMAAYALGWYYSGRQVIQAGRFALDDFGVITTAAENYEDWTDVLDAYAGKVPINAERFYELENSLRAEYWTIAKTKSASVIAQMQNLVARSAGEGIYFAEVEAQAEAIYAAGGLDPLKPWHLQQVLRTNTSITFGAANEQFLDDPAAQDMLEGVMTITAADDVVRPNHAALDGFVFTIDVMDREGLWKPLGFNCRCSDAMVGKGEATPRLSVPEGGGPDKGPKGSPDMWHGRASGMLGGGLDIFS